MGSPVGCAEFRAESLVSAIKGKFTKFYDMLKLIPIEQHRLKLNHVCGGKRKLNHLLRTVQPEIWNLPVFDGGDVAQGPMELATAIMMEEHRLMLDKGKVVDLPLRLVEQLDWSLIMGVPGLSIATLATVLPS